MTTLGASSAVHRALDAAQAAWGRDWHPSFTSRAPGRLELLGNHVDYNGGHVLAAAIDREVCCLYERGALDELDVRFADRDGAGGKLATGELVEWHKGNGSPDPLDYVR